MIRKALEADIGFTWERNFRLRDEAGTPIDFTSVGFEGTNNVVFNVHNKVDNTLIDTASGSTDSQGNISIKFTDEQTADWPTTPLTYELVWFVALEGSVDKFRLMSGDFKAVK